MIKKIYAIDVLKKVPEEWTRRYQAYLGDAHKEDITRKLNELVWPFSKEQIDKIIGNKSWGKVSCTECGKDCSEIVRIGDEPDWDARWVDLCNDCLVKAVLA